MKRKDDQYGRRGKKRKKGKEIEQININHFSMDDFVHNYVEEDECNKRFTTNLNADACSKQINFDLPSHSFHPFHVRSHFKHQRVS
jgi:hypothetical protein